MWLSFWAAFALLCALLLVPGALMLRALGTSRLEALCMAPLVAIAFLGSTGIVLGALGVECHAGVSATPLLLASLACVAVRLVLDARLRRRAAEGECAGPGGTRDAGASAPVFVGAPVSRRGLLVVGLFVAVGLFATCTIFVSGLDGPASQIQAWDNVCHFNLLRSMAESGNWSSLSTTYYPAVDGVQVGPFASGNGFYPAAWHLLGAFLVDALGVPVTLAANVVISVGIAVVYPLGMCLLLAVVFSRRPRTVAFGALCCLAFGSFPWALVVRWSLYPYLLSLCLVPASACTFMVLCAHGVERRRRLACLFAFLCCGVALALSQPSSVFAVGVFLVPYLVWRIVSSRRRRGSHPRGTAWVVAGFLLLVALVWVTLYGAPFMQNVVQFFWAPMQSLGEALGKVFGAAFVGGYVQPVLAVTLVVGFVSAWRQDRTRWVSVSCLLALVLYVVAVTGGDTPLKHLLSGFWYTDPYRLAAMTVVFCVPLVALGLQVCIDAAGALLVRALDSALPGGRRVPANLPACLVCALFLAAAFFPAVRAAAGAPLPVDATSDLGDLTMQIAERNRYGSWRGYTGREEAFVQRVLDLVGPDEMVLNMPFDGSIYAYGVDGLNVFYRSMGGYAEAGETWESVVLRTSLAWMDESPNVRRALANEHIRYVMLLNGDDDSDHFTVYQPRLWRGLNRIDDHTPGFEVVLAEGDMRLYRIVE